MAFFVQKNFYMAKILISFSGHKLSILAIEKLKKEFDLIEEVFIPYIDFENEIELALEGLINQIEYQLDGSQNITIILPGHSNLSALLYNYLFGLIGHPPDIYMLRETDDGQYLPFKLFKGRDIKKAGRLLRERKIKN